MKKMKFEIFKDADNFPDDDDIELYIIKNKRDCLYIGISKSNVWNRWFSGFGSHMFYDARERLCGNSRIGIEISDNFPESYKWTVELWTLEDCLRFLNVPYEHIKEYRQYVRPGTRIRFDIKDVEPKMIQKIHPKFNVTYNV